MADQSRRRFLQAIALGSGAVAAHLALAPAQASSRLRLDSKLAETLQASVPELIADTYLSHAADFPDPNEGAEVLGQYLKGNDLHWSGDHAAALALFTQLVADFPDSRHAHAGLGCALRHAYEEAGDRAALRSAIDHLTTAAEIGMRYGRVRYTDLLAEGLPALGDKATFDRLFQQAFSVDNQRYLTLLHYAEGLGRLGDPRAEGQYQRALHKQPEGTHDATASYAQWLIDAGRYDDALSALTPREHADYLSFLRGVAFERLGQPDAAAAAYASYRGLNEVFAAPARYRMAGSTVQQGLRFDDDIEAQTHCQGHVDLSTLIYCESGGESVGAQRAVGWTVRTRVFKGTIYCCISISNSGSTLCDKYYSVIHQTSQFYLGCGTRSSTSNQVAYDVFYGTVPDPVSGYCPCGSKSGTNCGGTCSCSSSSGAASSGPIWFYGTSGSCPSFTCRTGRGKTCGNGGSDNCFYSNSCANNSCC